MNDFTKWLRSSIKRGSKHEILPGYRVRLAEEPYPKVLTSNQATEMAEWLLRCADDSDELRLCRGDGTDRLLTVLYGEAKGNISKALGGSNARMLHDAALEIERLRRLVPPQRSLPEERANAHFHVRG